MTYQPLFRACTCRESPALVPFTEGEPACTQRVATADIEPIAQAFAPTGPTPLIVCGSALEFYTRGDHTTVDVDLVIDGIQEIDRRLHQFGFRRLAGASYVHPAAHWEPLGRDTPIALRFGVQLSRG